METGSSLSHSQELVMCLYPEPDQSSLISPPFTLLEFRFSYCPSKWPLFLTKALYAYLLSPIVPYAPPISFFLIWLPKYYFLSFSSCNNDNDNNNNNNNTSFIYISTRVGTLIVATIFLQLIQNRYMFRSFTVLQCSHQHCVKPVASDVEVVGYL